MRDREFPLFSVLFWTHDRQLTQESRCKAPQDHHIESNMPPLSVAECGEEEREGGAWRTQDTPLIIMQGDSAQTQGYQHTQVIQVPHSVYIPSILGTPEMRTPRRTPTNNVYLKSGHTHINRETSSWIISIRTLHTGAKVICTLYMQEYLKVCSPLLIYIYPETDALPIELHVQSIYMTVHVYIHIHIHFKP